MIRIVRINNAKCGYKSERCNCGGRIERCNIWEWEGTLKNQNDKYIFGKHKYCYGRILFLRDILNTDFGDWKLL